MVSRDTPHLTLDTFLDDVVKRNFHYYPWFGICFLFIVLFVYCCDICLRVSDGNELCIATTGNVFASRLVIHVVTIQFLDFVPGKMACQLSAHRGITHTCTVWSHTISGVTCSNGLPVLPWRSPFLTVQNYPPWSIRDRGPHHFPTPLSTWAPSTWPQSLLFSCK